MSVETRVPQYGILFDRWEIGAQTAPNEFRLVSGNSGETCLLKVACLIEEPGTRDALSEEEWQEYTLRRRQRRKELEKRLLTIVGTDECLEYTFLDWEDDGSYGRDLLIRARMEEPLPEEISTPVPADPEPEPVKKVRSERTAKPEEKPAADIYDVVIKVLIGAVAVAILCVAFLFGKIVLDLKHQVDQTAVPPTVPAATVAEVPAEVPTEAPTEAPTEPPVILDSTKIIDLSMGLCHTAALYEDGTVDVVYLKDEMRRKYPNWEVWDATAATEWTDITQISVGRYHMAGLKSDGTVVAVGTNAQGECDTSQWTDILCVATGDHVTVGLKADGTLVSAGSTAKIGDLSGITGVTVIDLGSGSLEYLQADGSWKRHLSGGADQDLGTHPDLVKIYSTETDSLGILSDGTLVVGRSNQLSRTKLAEWTDIVDVYGNASCLLGLKSDGTVLAMGTNNQNNQQNVAHWTDIVRLVGPSLGLKKDGTLVLSGTDLFKSFDLSPLNKAPAAVDGKAGKVTSGSGVNVRSFPGINCDIVTRLPVDTPVIILEEKTTYDGMVWGRTWYGWISMDYVALT